MKTEDDIVEKIEDIEYRLQIIERSLIYIEKFTDYIVKYLNENGEFTKHMRSNKFKALKDENFKDV